MTHAAGGDLSAEIAARLASGTVTIPVLPTVASAVLALVNDPDADIGSLAGTIRNDQALAGHVMKFANSPLLRGSVPIVSLQQAIARLGMRHIADIALAACMGPKLFKAPAYAALIDAIWTESLATGIWAREIARGLRRNVEVSFLCGLLHQVGKPVVLQGVQEILGAAPEQQPDHAAILQVLDEQGAAAGTVVAAKWHLPELVAEAIMHIKDYRAAPQSPELVAMVSAARAFAQTTLLGGAPDVDALAALPEMEEINLYRADVERLCEQTDAVRATLKELAL